MPRYLIQGNYIGDGIKGLMKEGGSGRVEAIRKLAESVGGKVEAVYYAFGASDVFVIVELPDNESAMGVSIVTNGSGLVSVRTTVLMTPEQVDEAVKRTPSYRPPGG